MLRFPSLFLAVALLGLQVLIGDVQAQQAPAASAPAGAVVTVLLLSMNPIP